MNAQIDRDEYTVRWVTVGKKAKLREETFRRFEHALEKFLKLKSGSSAPFIERVDLIMDGSGLVHGDPAQLVHFLNTNPEGDEDDDA